MKSDVVRRVTLPGKRRPPHWIVVSLTPIEVAAIAAGTGMGKPDGGGRQRLQAELVPCVKGTKLEMPRDLAVRLADMAEERSHGGLGPAHRRAARKARKILNEAPLPTLF